MKTLIAALDDLYMKESIHHAYETYRNFNGFQRIETISILNYIVEFHQRHNKSTKYKMALLDVALAFKFLDNANVNHQQQA